MTIVLFGGDQTAAGAGGVYERLLKSARNKHMTVLHVAPDGTDDDLYKEARAASWWIDDTRKLVAPHGGTVEGVPIGSPERARSADVAAALDRAGFVYIQCVRPDDLPLVNFPGSPVVETFRRGAATNELIVGGGGVGAMFFCERTPLIPMDFLNASHEHWYEPGELPPIDMSSVLADMKIVDCLNLAPFAMLLPHWTRFSGLYEQFLPFLAHIEMFKGGRRVVGVDNETAIIHIDGRWEVGGGGSAVLIGENLEVQTFKPGEVLPTRGA